MRYIRCCLVGLLASSALLVGCTLPEAIRPMSKLVRSDSNGRLAYLPDEYGNRIPDFSNAGYMGGGVAIPSIPAARTLLPGPGDDTARVQAAIDEVCLLPLDHRGFRGAILLTKGRYEIAGTLNIKASGIVLRGEGEAHDGTFLAATGTEQRTLIRIGGGGKLRRAGNKSVAITDDLVPLGARSFHVEDSSPFDVGDKVIINRPSTAEWINDLGMDQIPSRSDGRAIRQWAPGSKDLRFDRVITAIAGDLITLDAPILSPLDARYGGATIYEYEFPERISNIGIENLLSVSEYASPLDEAHAWTFVSINEAQNTWVRDVTTMHYGFGLVHVERNAKWVTVQDCSCLDSVSQITGNRRYSFLVDGQLTLVQRCYARNGRHDFVLGSVVPGPNVFLDCIADYAHAETGPHHRWAVGALFDNVRVNGNSIRVQDSGNAGTGHGWTGAYCVLWNCRADELVIQRPPTAQNWAIGCWADNRRGDGYFERFGVLVRPRSLYLAQLSDRLGESAVDRIARFAEN